MFICPFLQTLMNVLCGHITAVWAPCVRTRGDLSSAKPKASVSAASHRTPMATVLVRGCQCCSLLVGKNSEHTTGGPVHDFHRGGPHYFAWSRNFFCNFSANLTNHCNPPHKHTCVSINQLNVLLNYSLFFAFIFY